MFWNGKGYLSLWLTRIKQLHFAVGWQFWAIKEQDFSAGTLLSKMVVFQCWFLKASRCLRSERRPTSCQLKVVKGVICAVSLCDFENLTKLCTNKAKSAKGLGRHTDYHILKAEMFHFKSSKWRSNSCGLFALLVRRKKLQAKITGWLLNETGSSTNTAGELENTS